MALWEQFEERYGDDLLCSSKVADRVLKEHGETLFMYCADTDLPFGNGKHAMYDWRAILTWLGY